MRLLCPGNDHGDGRPAAPQPEADPGADRGRLEREPLSLLRLRERAQGGRARRPNYEGGEMKTSLPELEFPEPERYELHEGPFYHFEVSRREFVATLGAGIMISVAVPSGFGQRAGRGGGGGGSSANLAQRLHIGADGNITVFTSKVEVGQGSRTQLTQAAAEELHVPVERLRLVMGDTAGPDDGGTAGSGTTPRSVPTI